MNALMPLIEASLRGALLIAVLVLLRVPLRRLIGNQWFCALWIVVLIRLAVPGSIQSNWSVFNWWPQEKPVPVQPSVIQTRVTVLPASGTAGASRTTVAFTPLAPPSIPASRDWMLFAWLAGAVGTAALFIWRIVKTMRMAELADRVALSRSRLTHTVGRLEANGVVRRDPCDEDGRGVQAVLTEQGFDLLGQAADTHVRGVQDHLIAHASDRELSAIGKVMDRVVTDLHGKRF